MQLHTTIGVVVFLGGNYSSHQVVFSWYGSMARSVCFSKILPFWIWKTQVLLKTGKLLDIHFFSENWQISWKLCIHFHENGKISLNMRNSFGKSNNKKFVFDPNVMFNEGIQIGSSKIEFNGNMMNKKKSVQIECRIQILFFSKETTSFSMFSGSFTTKANKHNRPKQLIKVCIMQWLCKWLVRQSMSVRSIFLAIWDWYLLIIASTKRCVMIRSPPYRQP